MRGIPDPRMACPCGVLRDGLSETPTRDRSNSVGSWSHRTSSTASVYASVTGVIVGLMLDLGAYESVGVACVMGTLPHNRCRRGMAGLDDAESQKLMGISLLPYMRALP